MCYKAVIHQTLKLQFSLLCRKYIRSEIQQVLNYWATIIGYFHIKMDGLVNLSFIKDKVK
jgi:hypothetical protein